MMEMTFFDWAYLGTFAGALAAVALVTEMIKGLPGIRRVPTQVVSWVLAVAVLMLSQEFGGTLTWKTAVLTLLNGAMVSLAANGGYEALKRIVGGKKEESANE